MAVPERGVLLTFLCYYWCNHWYLGIQIEAASHGLTVPVAHPTPGGQVEYVLHHRFEAMSLMQAISCTSSFAANMIKLCERGKEKGIG